MRKSLALLFVFIFCIIGLSVLMFRFPAINQSDDVQNRKDGIFYTYYDNGHLLSMTFYLNGQIDGMQTVYHENGNVLRTSEYLKGFKDGKEHSYYKNSLLKSVVLYHNGMREGEAILYFNDKNFSSKKRPVQAKVVFKNDKAVSGFCYIAGTEHKITFNEAHLYNFELDMTTPCDIVRQTEDK